MPIQLEDVRKFIQGEVIPHEHLLLGGRTEELEVAVASLRDDVRSRGWWAPQVPQKLGGQGLDLVAHGALSEVLGHSPLGHYVFGAQAPDAGNIELLEEFADEEQSHRYLIPLAKGKMRSCFAMTEPGHAGSDPVLMSTTAVRDGDAFVINGHKWFTTGADGAGFAVVMAVTDSNAEPHRRASMFLVPTDTSGFEHIRDIQIMGEVGHSIYSHAELRFDNCRVPASALLGKVGEGFVMAQKRLGPGRIHHCMRWIGLAERAHRMMCERALTREVKNGLLADQQTVRNWIAESRAEINAARLLVQDTAQKICTAGVQSARTEISIIKFFVAGMLNRTVDRSLQTHGALGMTDDTVLSWIYRHERAARIYDGPDEVHKQVVARHCLRNVS